MTRIYLGAERVDANDADADRIAQAELAAVAAAFDDVLFFMERAGSQTASVQG